MLSVKDILRPKIININGRRYRQLPIKTTEQETNSYADLDTYIEEGNLKIGVFSLTFSQ